MHPPREELHCATVISEKRKQEHLWYELKYIAEVEAIENK